MIRAIIVDDEEKGRIFLKNMVDEYCKEVQIVAMADAIDTGIETIRAYHPDLVFLDIKMPRGTGFDVLKELHEMDFEVIFTTAHDNYALTAIKFSAIDYLLKPIDINELQEAVEKMIRKKDRKLKKENFEVFLSNLQMENSMKKIALPTQDGLMFVKVEHIIRCEGEGAYTKIKLVENEKLMVSKNLKEIEGLLFDCGFFRVHKSHLINLSHVKRYIKGSGGTVVMSDQHSVEVSKRRKEAFLEQLNI